MLTSTCLILEREQTVDALSWPFLVNLLSLSFSSRRRADSQCVTVHTHGSLIVLSQWQTMPLAPGRTMMRYLTHSNYPGTQPTCLRNTECQFRLGKYQFYKSLIWLRQESNLQPHVKGLSDLINCLIEASLHMSGLCMACSSSMYKTSYLLQLTFRPERHRPFIELYVNHSS